MKKLLFVLGLFTINYTTSAQTISYASPLTQTDIVNAELILPNGVITNPAYDYYSPYEVIKQKAGYLITPTEMQSAGFVNNDEIRNLSWTLSQGQQNETSGIFRLYIKNTLDVTNTGLQIGNYVHEATITLPAQAGQLTFDFFSPFIYTGGGLYIYYDFIPDGYSGWTPMLKTAVNTNLTDGYRVQAVLGGEYQGYVINTTHSNRPVTSLGKLTCPFPGYHSQNSYTDNSGTIIWPGTGTYEIEYGISPYEQGTGGIVLPQIISTSTENSYIINNLLPASLYDVYIRKVCSSGSNGFWKKTTVATSISTPITSFPYFVPFSENVITSGWKHLGPNSSMNWLYYSSDNGGNLGIKDRQNGENNKTIYSRGIQLTAGISYTLTFEYSHLWLASSINGDSENLPNLNIILTNSINAETPISLVSINNISNSEFQLATVQFTASTTEIYYIGVNGVFAANATQDPTFISGTWSGFNYLHFDNFNLDVNLGIDINKINHLSIYPNPTENILNFSQPLRNINIYDLTGRNIKSYANIQDKIDVSELARGNYLLQGHQDSGEKVIKKFIKN